MERENIFGNGAIAALVLVIAMAFYWTKNSWGPSSAYVKLPESESYEMGKAHSSAANEYDLTGRKIVETVNDPNKPLAAATPATSVSSALPNAKPAAAVSNAVAGKAPANSASQAALDVKRKAQLNVNVIAASDNRMRGFEDTKANFKNVQQPIVSYAQPVVPAVAKDETPEKPKLTAAQWRAVLFADPSANSVRNFVTAYSSGEINAGEFHQIAESLFKDNASDRQEAGLLAYSSDYSVKSFSSLSAHYQAAETSEEMKTKIYSVLRTYGEAGKLSILSRIFYLNDTAALTLATRILEQTLAAQKPVAPQDTRPGRGPVSVSIPPSSFQAFLAPLNRLLANQEAGLASQAQALIDAIKSLSNA